MSFFSNQGSLEQRRYRLQQIKDMSPTARSINTMKLDPASFAVVEKIALQEARQTAATSGRLFATSERDDTGRKVTTFEGDMNAWMKHFKSPGAICAINKDAGTHEETVRLREGQRIRIEG